MEGGEWAEEPVRDQGRRRAAYELKFAAWKLLCAGREHECVRRKL